MNPRFPSWSWRSLLTGGWLLVAGHCEAQWASEEDPRWLRMRLPEASVGVEVEGLHENVSLGSSSSVHEQLSVIPLLGLRTGGSIYHPNLLTFDFNGEGGLGWLNDSFKSPGSNETRNEDQNLLRYFLQVNLLSGKPYNASFDASQDHTFRNYDVFSTYTVDSTRYAGRMSWTTETLSLNADMGVRNETSTGLQNSGGLSDVTQIDETYFNFNGTHKRDTGQSTLIYRYDEFDNSYNAGPTQSSVNHTVSLSDSETFGSRRQGTATTGASYSQYDYSGQQTETINANENITFNHRPKLDSFLTVDFNHSTMDPTTSSMVQGSAGVRHRLYDSLTSTFDGHGSYDTSSGRSSSGLSSSGSNDRYGVGLHEDYTKRLGDWGRLSLGGGIIADHEDHEASGSVLTKLDEKHQLHLLTNPNYRPAYLNQPRVLVSTILVRGPGGQAIENTDYMVIPTGELTEIRLIMGSLVLHDGDEVLVTYQSLSLYNASFASLNGTVQIRLDLFNCFGLYGRLNWLDNNAPPTALTETLTDLVGGTDFTWRWLRLGAEYEEYDSSFTQYDSWRFYQTGSWQPFDNSTFSLDFSESFYRYPDDSNQTRYQAVGRYNLQLSAALAWYAEGGYSLQDIMGTEQNYGSARTGLSWVRGKLNFRTGYEYNAQMTLTGAVREERDRNYFFVYLKRTF